MNSIQKFSGQGKVTRAARVSRQLSDDIICGKLAPGTRLDEVEQAMRYGVSRTPVREAFRQLAALGLVETRPHRGVFVVPMSPRRISELCEICAELLGRCGCLAVARMTDDQFTGLRDAHGDEEIVRAVLDGVGNSVLRDLTDGVWGRLRPLCPSDGVLDGFAKALVARDCGKAAMQVDRALAEIGASLISND